jgi:hypothetical protein
MPMKNETKDSIRVLLGLLTDYLAEENVAIGVLVNKKDFNNSKLVFVDWDSYQKGDLKDGFTVDFAELNKALFLGKKVEGNNNE